MRIVKKGKYLVVIRKNKMDKNGNPRYILNIFEENENGEYIEIKEIRTTSYNIDLKVDYYINKLLEGKMYRVMVGNRCFQEYSKLNEAKEMASIIEPVEKMRGNEVYIAHKNGKRVEV